MKRFNIYTVSCKTNALSKIYTWFEYVLKLEYGSIISDLRDNFYGPLFWIAYYKVFSYIKYKILGNNNTKIIIRRKEDWETSHSHVSNPFPFPGR